MDLPEGKQALEDIQALERRLDARIKEARAEAKKIEAAAQVEAAELVTGEERRIAAARRRPPAMFAAPPERSGPPPRPDERLVEELAGELFELIKRT